jgi:hypothetical protein
MTRLGHLLVLTAACGSSGHNRGDGGPGDGALAAGLSRCTDTGAPRAVLAAVTANDVVEVYAMFQGKLATTGVHLTGITKPQNIVMRDDGMEALVGWGGFGNAFGLARIELSPDASLARVAQVLQVGTDTTPVAISYGSDHDHAVIALLSAQSELLGFTRQGTDFVAGTRAAAPADFPLDLAARKGTQDVLMSRSQVGVDTTLDVYRLRLQSDGTWKSTGSHASVPDGPIAMALPASGNALYVPTSDPANPVMPGMLNVPGIMHAVKITDSAFTDAGTVALPQVSTLLAVDPGGRFIVADGDVYTLDGVGVTVTSYTWQTVGLAADGSLADVYTPTAPKDGLLFDDLKITPNGLLVAKRAMYAGTVAASMENPLELWAQPAWGAWELCDTEYLSGGAKLAIAP